MAPIGKPLRIPGAIKVSQRPVRIDLVAGPGGPRVILRGRVLPPRPDGQGRPAGFTMKLGPMEREKVNYLNGFVRGGLLDLRQRRRLPVRLPVVYRGLAGPARAYTRDINEEGLFVVTEVPLAEGARVGLSLDVLIRDVPEDLTGVVTHTVVVEDEDVPGMGIRLTLEPTRSAAFAQIVDDLERRFLEGSLPDQALL